MKIKFGKTVTAQCEKIQMVTTLCQFHCGVAEMRSLGIVALLLVSCQVMSSFKMVVAVSNEGFLVKIVKKLST